MFVKPGMRPDDRDRALVVRGPNGRLLSELGGEVPETQFWHRRLRDGDVVPGDPVPLDTEVRYVAADGSVTVRPLEPGARAGPDPGFDPAHPAMIGGDPLMLTAAEWARVPVIEPPNGPAVVGFSTDKAIHDRDPAAPLITHEQYLREIAA